MFQPVIPFNGLGGLKFLQDTYDRQLGSFTQNPQHARDVTQFREKLALPISLNSFLENQQLLRTAMTSFGLAGEEWKRGFIEKALTEATNPDSTFLQRLNNPAYSAFAAVFAPQDGQISLTAETIDQVVLDFDKRSFELAVGQVDEDMRLSLNFEARIDELVNGVTSEEAGLFRILGDVPVRSVLETALGLPSQIRKLPIDQQSSVLRQKLTDVLGISSLSDLGSADQTAAVIKRFHALSSIDQASSSVTSGSVALTLLSTPGLGGVGAANLFFSRLGS